MSTEIINALTTEDYNLALSLITEYETENKLLEFDGKPKLDYQQMVIIVAGLIKNKTLTGLAIEGIYIGYDKSLPKVFNFLLLSHSNLSTLNLVRTRIADDWLSSILFGVNQTHYLQELNLDQNFISNKGAILIAQFLTDNKNLVSLNLANNDIGKVGGRAIAKALNTDNVLQTLVLAANNLGSAVNDIAIAMQTNTSITHLELENTGINSYLELANLIKLNTSLRYLGMEDEVVYRADKADKLCDRNDDDDDSDPENYYDETADTNLIIESLKSNSTLTRLNISANREDTKQILAKIVINKHNFDLKAKTLQNNCTQIITSTN